MTAVATKKELALTRDQEGAVDQVMDFWRAGEAALLTLGGYAGTGKTTVIGEAVKRVSKLKDRPMIAFCAFTGRAASVLRGKLEAAELLEMTDYCGTIHGLIYTPNIRDGMVVGWKKAEALPFDFIVVDEGSMLTKTLYDDLASFEIPMLVVGDHGQLPPIGDAFNLMAAPDIRLETIHRQAAGDPIIKLSMIVREGGTIPVGRHGEFVSKTTDRNILDKVPDVSDPMILCGYNRTRVALNRYVRGRLGLTSALPKVGERVICLKNNRDAGVYNGMIGYVEDLVECDKEHVTLKAKMEGGVDYRGDVWRAQWGSEQTLRPKDKQEARRMGDLFDWGYAMTVHKSQGSEARRVVVFEERLPKMNDEDWKRWLYTAVTRARERLLVVGS